MGGIVRGTPAPASSIMPTFRAMIDPSSLATADPLGIGGLLADAGRLVQT